MALAAFAAELCACSGETSTVSGTRGVQFITASGVETRPLDLSGYRFAALVDEGGAYDEVEGAGAADGTFAIHEVPEGAGYLLWQRGEGSPVNLVELEERRGLDLGWSQFGRADATYATEGTTLRVSLDGLQPWSERDTLVLFSASAGTLVPLESPAVGVGAAGVVPEPDATSASGDVDLALAFYGRVPIVERGDGAQMFQMATSAAASGRLSTIARIMTVDLEVELGAATELTGTLKPTLADKGIRVAFDVPRAEALAEQAHPDAKVWSSSNVDLGALPGWNGGSYFPCWPALVGYQVELHAAPLDETIRYADPLPAEWDRFVDATTLVSVDVTAEGASYAWPVIGRIGRRISLSELAIGKLDSVVGPVRRPSIDGADAYAGLTGVSESPTIAWSPPVEGVADYAWVVVYEVRADEYAWTRIDEVLVVTTSEPSVTVPPGVLQTGKTYVVRIDAIAGARPDTSFASLITAPFRVD